MISLKSQIPPILIVSLVSLIYNLPILLNPQLFLNRANDLEEFFWPTLYFVKTQLLQNHTFPLWNNLILAGTPLLPDPQAPLFYLPNVIFLITGIEGAMIASILIHSIGASLAAYFCARVGFNFSKTASLLTGIFYLISPKLTGFLEAGHLGLIYSYPFLPLVLLSTIKLAHPQKKWILIFSLSAAAIFFTHLVTFLIVIFFVSLVFLFLKISARNQPLKSITYFLIALLATIGLVSISLVSQISWFPQTTRFFLLKDRDVYPKWQSAQEFIGSILFPLQTGVSSIDSEKWLAVGFFLSVLAFLGWFYLRTNLKVATASLMLVIISVVLNNKSPVYNLLLSQDLYVLARVASRFWIVMIVLLSLLAGFGWDNLVKKYPRGVVVLVALALAESVFISWMRLAIPAVKSRVAPELIYNFLKNDREQFRVFCTTRCLSQKQAAKYNLELLDGYNTLIQTNFYKHMWQLTQSYWNYYSLSVPPVGTYTFEKLQPDAKSLGLYNVKYVISEHALLDKNFVFFAKFGNFSIYKNNLFKPRAYFLADQEEVIGEIPVIKYLPNQIVLDTSKKLTSKAVLADVYAPGWVAYLNGKSQAEVLEKPDALRLVNLRDDTNFVELRYQPKSFKIGLLITVVTLILLSTLTFNIKKS